MPLRAGKVADDMRIRASLPTLELLRKQGARVVLASHLGRPRGEPRSELSLRPVAEHMGIPLAPDCVGPAVASRVSELRNGEVLLLENLRFHAGEESNDPEFAADLASLANAYVNDAFGSAHRAHASTLGVPERCSPVAAGLLLAKEVEVLTRLRDRAERPFLCVLGGVKVSDKLAVLESLATRVDALVIGGAMAFTFLQARGEPVGASLVERDQLERARRLLEAGTEILLPVDHVVAKSADDPPRPPGEA